MMDNVILKKYGVPIDGGKADKMLTDSTIETTRFFKKSHIHLLKDRIRVRKSSPFDSIEFEISYENIETKKIIETKVNFGLLYLTSFLTIMGLLFIFGRNNYISKIFFISAIMVLFIALATKLKIITIRSLEGNNLELYFTDRDKEDVLIFADKIINSTNSYLLNKYSKIDKDLPIESQLENLTFLRNKELITDEKFEQLKNQLLGKDNKQTIGYR